MSIGSNGLKFRKNLLDRHLKSKNYKKFSVFATTDQAFENENEIKLHKFCVLLFFKVD